MSIDAADEASRRATKAVIPAAGLGTRFLPATKAQPKGMLAIIDKPAIQYVVEEAVAAGLRDIVMVISPGNRSLQEHFGRSPDLEKALEAAGKLAELETVRAIAELADIEFIVQDEPLGLGHAVSMAREHVGDDAFAVLLGDDIIHHGTPLLADLLAVHEQRGTSVVAVRLVSDDEIGLYGAATGPMIDQRLVQLDKVIEKPAPGTAPSNLAVMGRYVFTPAIFDALATVPPGAGGEIQLTDAIQMVAAGEGVLGWTFEHGRFDAGNKLDYLRATVEFALERADLGDQFRQLLYGIVDRERAGQHPQP